MELIIPYLMIVFGVTSDGEAEVVHRQLAISKEQCGEMLVEETPKWVSDKAQQYHLVCLEFPGREEFDVLFSENR